MGIWYGVRVTPGLATTPEAPPHGPGLTNFSVNRSLSPIA